MRTGARIGRSFGVLLMCGSVIRNVERTTSRTKQHYDLCIADDSAGRVSYANVQPHHRVRSVYIVREVRPHHEARKKYIGARRGATTCNSLPHDFGWPPFCALRFTHHACSVKSPLIIVLGRQHPLLTGSRLGLRSRHTLGAHLRLSTL
jgi:hypothetical protein